jgi:flagellar motility protein MotE (MotC chaperone)
MEKNLKSEISRAKEDIDDNLDIDEFDNKLEELKDHIKKLKKLKKRHEKYEKLEKEREHILRKLEGKEKDKKRKHR